MVGRRLDPAEIDGYGHIDAILLASVRVLKVPFLSPGTTGMRWAATYCCWTTPIDPGEVH